MHGQSRQMKQKGVGGEEERRISVSSHYWGFGKDLKVTALEGLLIYFLSSFPINLVSKQVSVWFLCQV